MIYVVPFTCGIFQRIPLDSNYLCCYIRVTLRSATYAQEKQMAEKNGNNVPTDQALIDAKAIYTVKDFVNTVTKKDEVPKPEGLDPLGMHGPQLAALGDPTDWQADADRSKQMY